MVRHIDFMIIGLSLIGTLFIGIYYGRGIKTFQEYAVGNRKMSTSVIAISLIATIYGGSHLGVILDQNYRQGFEILIAHSILIVPMLYLFSRVTIPRMKEFEKHFSIAESMGSLYGSAARIITALLSILLAIAYLTTQIKVGFEMMSILFPKIISLQTYSTILLTLLVIAYASFGGARAVAITDVYQFLLFGLCFPLLIFVLLFSTEDLATGWQKLTALPQFNPNKMCTAHTLTSLLPGFIFRLLVMVIPAYIQRFYMASSVGQAAKVFNKITIAPCVIALLIFSVAAALHIHGDSIPSNQNVFHYILSLSYFPGMLGILVTAMLALLMSTADSHLHIASVLFTNDLWPFIARSTKLHNNCSLRMVRIASMGIGIISLLLVFHTSSIIQLMHKTYYFYWPTVSVPFIIACLGFRPRSLAVRIVMGLNIIVATYFIFYQKQAVTHNQIILSMIISAGSLFALHYLLPKCPHTGWVGIPDSSAWDLQNQITKRWWSTRMRRLKMLFTSSYRVSIFPTQERTFVAVGSYTIINAIIALCFIQRQYFLPYVYLYMAVMALGTILALYPALHTYQKGGTPLLHNLWPMLLFLLLFITPLQFAKLGHYSPMVCALLIASISLSIVLLSVEGSSMLLLCVLVIHKFLPPYINFVDLFWGSLKKASVIELMLTTALVSITLVGFLLYKYLRDKATAKLKIIELTRTYEQRISLEAIYSQAHWARLDATAGGTLLRAMGDTLQETADTLYKQDPSGIRSEITRFNKKLQKFSDCLAWRAQEERNLKLNKKSIQPIPLEPTILKVNQQILDLGEPLALLLRKQTPIAEIIVDPALLACLLLLNLWAISKSQPATDHIVTLTLAATTLQYGLATETEADLPSLILPALAFCFSTDTSLPNLKPSYRITEWNANTALPASEAQFYQLESKQIVEAHGGYVEIIESPTKVSCLYVFPLDGRKVMRFKTYDPADLVANALAETAESLAQEQELIALLTAQTTLKEELIEQTIAFIKKAHGLVRRKSGAPYYTHPMAVAKLLLEVTQDPDTILAGLLHDIVEDTPVTLPQLELMYGAKVAAIVDQVTHYNTNGYPWELDKVENKNILHQCRDTRVVQVKLADRLHNMRTLSVRKPSDQQRIAKETLAFYIPWGKNHKAPPQWLAEMQRICEEVLSS
ncbi:sodium:solute symporter family transporter [Candidatus Cardinium hertigii]|uniref:Bifunctional (P)ppGpp synthase/hydrolase SpoT n=1 Tax=Candidatus Cardinium hertigii TaxID=247481 RepID=A0A2Z3L796_9BACT|nr:sodium:solute symporter family protein [Candidatus Cardinium hertigii]AWN81507.1 Bifunctional (p)ppGpp synthase/hydrolase SpoT [Candidatus Cardinium hertigii]